MLESQGRLECWQEEPGKSSLYGFDVTGPTILLLCYYFYENSTYVFEAVKVAQVCGLL